MEWEVQLIESIQNNIDSTGLAIGKISAFIGGEKGILLILLIVMFCWKKDVGQKLALTLAAMDAWLPMIKSVVLRPRPYMQYPDRVKPLVLMNADEVTKSVAVQGYSFPSMHSAGAAAMFFSIARELKKRWFWILAFVVTFIVGFSRIAVGMHYPTDVLAGWILGIAAIFIISLLYRYVEKEWIRHLILLLSAAPGLFYVRTHDYFVSMGLLIGIIASIHFDKKYIDFQNTRNIWAMILRTVGAFVIYLVLNTLLKMPFSKDFIDSNAFGPLLVRMGRYAVISFLIMGVYPKIFPLFENIGRTGDR